MNHIKIEKPDYLACGERARLIPVIADSGKEGRISSAFLASLMSVNEYARGMLEPIGLKLGKNYRVFCYTEIVFKNSKNVKIRPDGLIIVDTGKKQWRALIESKIGKAELTKEQVEAYLDLAKEYKIDAVITISNQFVGNPTHHPIVINKQKTRSVDLFHWSWTYLMTEAVMWVKHHGISDPDQAYILEELVRYLMHPSSGVTSFDRMNAEWKDLCTLVQNRAPLNKNSKEVIEGMSAWHQYVRNISLDLCLMLGKNVTVSMKKAHREDAVARLQDDCQIFCNSRRMECELEIPNAASRLKLWADFETRSVNASMFLKAPEDKPTAKGRVGWLLHQLKACEEEELIVKASWPGRAPETLTALGKLRSLGVESLIGNNTTIKPTGFEIIYKRDLGARFNGAKTFAQESERVPLEFYKCAGQYLREWVAAPPQVKKDTPAEILEFADATIEPIIPQNQGLDTENKLADSGSESAHTAKNSASS